MKTLIKLICSVALISAFSIPTFANIIANPSFVNFGMVKIGGFSGGWRTVTIRNHSNVPVNISISSFCGMDFRVTNMCHGQLYANGSCSLSVDYSPQGPGYDSCTINVRDSNGGSSSISLTGTATAD